MRPVVTSMGLASSLIHVKLFLAVQNSSFCCLLLKMGVSYHIILIMITLVCSANSFAFTARCYSSRYLPTSANEPEVSPIGLLPR